MPNLSLAEQALFEQTLISLAYLYLGIILAEQALFEQTLISLAYLYLGIIIYVS